MAQPARPKQRVLVRWNGKTTSPTDAAPLLTQADDLDKSLLLFITHTCTEMGIKIPCKIYHTETKNVIDTSR